MKKVKQGYIIQNKVNSSGYDLWAGTWVTKKGAEREKGLCIGMLPRPGAQEQWEMGRPAAREVGRAQIIGPCSMAEGNFILSVRGSQHNAAS